MTDRLPEAPLGSSWTHKKTRKGDQPWRVRLAAWLINREALRQYRRTNLAVAIRVERNVTIGDTDD